MRFRNLERYSSGRGIGGKMQLSVPLPKTPQGRTYRFSPEEAAHPRHFLLGTAPEGAEFGEAEQARMKLTPRSPQTVCPYSGTVAEDDAFTHPDDRAAALKMVEHAAVADVRKHIDEMFSGMASRSKGFITYKKSGGSVALRPRFSRRDLLRELVCDHCQRDYGVYAIGLFCPDCGAPNLRLHFAREVELVDAQVLLAESLDEGCEELAYRLLGNAHEDVLTAFEATLKTVYLYGMAQRPEGAPPVKPVGNEFQNVERATRRFTELGFDPFITLSEAERAVLLLNIQKRHVVGHNLGIVDAKFAEQAGDARIGETVRLLADDIRTFAQIGQAIVDQLDAWLAGGAMAPGAGQTPAVVVSAPMLPKAESEVPEGLQLGSVAAKLGRWMALALETGRAGPVNLEALPEDLKAVPGSELVEAIAELEAEGLVTKQTFLGGGLPRVRATLELFASFDPLVSGHDPAGDAGALAVAVLGMESGISSQALHNKTGWNLRRFNPALGIMASYIGDGRVSKIYGMEYAVEQFHVNADDRVALKRFARQMGLEC